MNEKHFTRGGNRQNEVKLIFDKLLALLDARAVTAFWPQSIFREKPHSTWDNFFCGDDLMEYAAATGFPMTLTCRRDRLPGGVPGQYFQKKKTDSSPQTRAGRFEQPIFCIKDAGNNGAKIQLTTFQSTSSCNIIHVNAVNSCQLYGQTKERGRGDNKRKWAIGMNESRKLYLNSYGAIDRLDHLIQNTNMGYRTWKYWHAAMLHAKSMAVVIAYDMYLECCKGHMRAGEWKVDKPVDFYRFREKLGEQMLLYSPQERKYAGDERFRVSTAQHIACRPLSDLSSDTSIGSERSNISRESIKKMTGKRLCGDLDPLMTHLKAVKTLPNRNSKVCAVCGKDAYHYCSECVGPDGKRGVALHASHTLTKGDGVACFFHYHNTHFFRLARNDFQLAGIKKSSWCMPTKEEQTVHRRKVKRMYEDYSIGRKTLNRSLVAPTTTTTTARPSDWNENCV